MVFFFFLYAHPSVMVLGKNEADHGVHSPVDEKAVLQDGFL